MPSICFVRSVRIEARKPFLRGLVQRSLTPLSRSCFLALLFGFGQLASAQQPPAVGPSVKNEPVASRSTIGPDSLSFYLEKSRFTGDSLLLKDTLLVKRFRIFKNVYVWKRVPLHKGTGLTPAVADARPRNTPFLRVSGSIGYDYLFRSYVDTPFAQRDFRQHSVQAALRVVLRDKYPLNLSFATQQNNSPYFTTPVNLNLRFDPAAYLVRAKQEAVRKLDDLADREPNLALAKAALQQELEKYTRLKSGLNSPDLRQAIVEERERNYYRRLAEKNKGLPGFSDTAGLKLPPATQGTRPALPDSNAKAVADSLARTANRYQDERERIQKELDSSQQRLLRLQHKADSLLRLVNQRRVRVRQKIYAAKSTRDVEAVAQEEDLVLERQTKLQKILGKVQSIGLGRTVLNYSELTVLNVPLTGFSVEYGASLYTALAVGKIDYGFRDFFSKYRSSQAQNFAIGRIGLGQKEKLRFVISGFAGKKYSYGNRTNDTVSGYVNMAGYALEATYQKDANTGATFEVAKTTRPATGSFQQNGELAGLTRFGDGSTLGVSAKGQTLIKQWGTRLSGFYRKTGANFQSFNLYTYNTDQIAWHLKADQVLLKNKVTLTAMLRRNDFLNPFTDKTFKTNTVFKTFQAVVRIPKYPAVTVGYYPGSQVYLVDKTKLRENVYTILNASAVYNYSAGGVQMISALNLNRYTNKGTDSGLVAYNGSSYTASQTLLLDRLQIQGLYAFTDQEQMRYGTLEGNFDYTLSKAIRVGAGAKKNSIVDGRSFLGGQVFLSAQLKGLGRLQLQYDKTHLPTLQKSLLPVESGRLSWFKNF